METTAEVVMAEDDPPVVSVTEAVVVSVPVATVVVVMPADELAPVADAVGDTPAEAQ